MCRCFEKYDYVGNWSGARAAIIGVCDDANISVRVRCYVMLCWCTLRMVIDFGRCHSTPPPRNRSKALLRSFLSVGAIGDVSCATLFFIIRAVIILSRWNVCVCYCPLAYFDAFCTMNVGSPWRVPCTGTRGKELTMPPKCIYLATSHHIRCTVTRTTLHRYALLALLMPQMPRHGTSCLV